LQCLSPTKVDLSEVTIDRIENIPLQRKMLAPAGGSTALDMRRAPLAGIMRL
jgi:hypothetical protein